MTCNERKRVLKAGQWIIFPVYIEKPNKEIKMKKMQIKNNNWHYLRNWNNLVLHIIIDYCISAIIILLWIQYYVSYFIIVSFIITDFLLYTNYYRFVIVYRLYYFIIDSILYTSYYYKFSIIVSELFYHCELYYFSFIDLLLYTSYILLL